MKYLLTLLLAAVFSSVAFSQSQVKIGKQIWMSKNLDVSTFRNGDVIPEAKTIDELIKLSETEQPAWCYYEFDENNGKKYGKLYNGYAVSDPRGLAPSGWHIPKDNEWDILYSFIYQRIYFWVDIALKSKTAWIKYGNRTEYNTGNNKTGFSALPSGYCTVIGSDYQNWSSIGDMAKFWSSSKQHSYVGARPELIIRELYGESHGLNRTTEGMKSYLSVRCIKD